MVEGTPLLREHAAYTRIEGSNPSVSASKLYTAVDYRIEDPHVYWHCGFFIVYSRIRRCMDIQHVLGVYLGGKVFSPNP